jgi:HK97 family phage major capsid protein
MEKVQKKDISRYLQDLVKKSTGNNEAVNVDGAYAVGQYLSDEVFSQLEYKGIGIFDACKKVKALKGPQVKIRARVNQLQNESTTTIRTYWVDEGVASTVSKIKYQGKVLDLGKLVTRVPMTQEIVEDVDNIADIFIQEIGRASCRERVYVQV